MATSNSLLLKSPFGIRPLGYPKFTMRCRSCLSPLRTTSGPLRFRNRVIYFCGRTVLPRSRRFVCFASKETNIGRTRRGIDTRVDEERSPSFSINLAVLLAGFAFEAYRGVADNIGRYEIDAAGCRTVYLSESFFCDIYDGKLSIKLKQGLEFPALDPWGTSDPYVVMQLDDQVVKSKIKWGTKEPTWNEEFMLYTRQSSKNLLEVAAWDANLLTPHKRMGNAVMKVEEFCDGNLHELQINLEGMGGGGKLQLEVKYQSFEQIENEKKWWRIPFLTEFLQTSKFQPVFKMVIGSESISASSFVERAFGQFKQFNNAMEILGGSKYTTLPEASEKTGGLVQNCIDNSYDESNSSVEIEQVQTNQKDERAKGSDRQYWSHLSDVLSQMVVQKLRIPSSLEFKWDELDLLNRVQEQLQHIADIDYVKLGLAIPKNEDSCSEKDSDKKTKITVPNSILETEKISRDILRQIDSVFGALMTVTSSLSNLDKDLWSEGNVSQNQNTVPLLQASALDEIKSKEMKELFSTAESAMEAWAMLATSVGHPSFIKSEYEKICFLDNEDTDTQVTIWRDIARKRLIVAFRGTEQSKWKDLRTDLMLIPAAMNPERIGGESKDEIQVHSGFLGAYDSVRIRIFSIMKQLIYLKNDEERMSEKWQVHVTGHSLGGALATLLAMDLCSSLWYRNGIITVTMYNFGSPRVGNQRFAEVYNQKVKDSWRVVNHRDIVPTVPRLMGYCHVAAPVYLSPGALSDTLRNMVSLTDGYDDDVIGEYTPDILVNEFMKGEKELIRKILDTEIKLLSSIRDGSALMQHMEDFYYVALLENVSSYYRNASED